MDCTHLIKEVTLIGGEIAFWSLFSAKTIDMQIFLPVQPVVLAAEGKTGFGFGDFQRKPNQLLNTRNFSTLTHMHVTMTPCPFPANNLWLSNGSQSQAKKKNLHGTETQKHQEFVIQRQNIS